MVAFRNVGRLPDTDDSVVTKIFVEDPNQPYDFYFVVYPPNIVRAVGTGFMWSSATATAPVAGGIGGYGGSQLFAPKLLRNVTLTKVTYRCGTADTTSSMVVQLFRDVTAITGTSVTLPAANQVAGMSATGTWPVSAGEVLCPFITAIGAVGAQIGKGLTVEVEGNVDPA